MVKLIIYRLKCVPVKIELTWTYDRKRKQHLLNPPAVFSRRRNKNARGYNYNEDLGFVAHSNICYSPEHSVFIKLPIFDK